MNISGLGNTYNGINTNSKQYKALKEKGWLSGIMQNEAMMSSEERMIYETFGGRDTIINNLMKQFDSEGDLLNANGVAGMDVTGKGTSWQQLTSVSEEYRQKMFDNVKREFIQEAFRYFQRLSVKCKQRQTVKRHMDFRAIRRTV